MSDPRISDRIQLDLSSDCNNCFGLCCVSLPFTKSADFAFHKDGGTPCRNLQANYRCSIHQTLRNNGLRGCTVYECFGAGQQVSQVTYNGLDWRDNPAVSKQMFDVFPIMQQLHEMLYYLQEALHIEDAEPLHKKITEAISETKRLTNQDPESLLALHMPAHRSWVNELLLQTSELARAQITFHAGANSNRKKIAIQKDLIGAKLRGANLRGSNLRGVLLIAADLRDTDMRRADLIGADFRDANLRGADLSESIFLTQAQVNSASGDSKTKLPPNLCMPAHWLN
jgi:uncharacterized protein YjbI with pentapeptide repeats